MMNNDMDGHPDKDAEFFKKHTNFSKKDLKLFKEMKILILSPIMIAEPKWVKCMANMIALSWYFGLHIEKMGIAERMVVDWARESLAEEGLKDKSYIDGKPFTHFLWLDADHIFDPDMALNLAKHDLDAVSALYYSKSDNYLPVAYTPVTDDNKNPRHYPILSIPNTVWPVGAFGFGACLIRRRVFEGVPQPWFTLDYRCGEDFAFCTKAREYGFKFHVDGNYKIGHIGLGQVFGEEDLKKHLAEHPELTKEGVKRKIERGENL